MDTQTVFMNELNTYKWKDWVMDWKQINKCTNKKTDFMEKIWPSVNEH